MRKLCQLRQEYRRESVLNEQIAEILFANGFSSWDPVLKPNFYLKVFNFCILALLHLLTAQVYFKHKYLMQPDSLKGQKLKYVCIELFFISIKGTIQSNNQLLSRYGYTRFGC